MRATVALMRDELRPGRLSRTWHGPPVAIPVIWCILLVGSFSVSCAPSEPDEASPGSPVATGPPLEASHRPHNETESLASEDSALTIVSLNWLAHCEDQPLTQPTRHYRWVTGDYPGKDFDLFGMSELHTRFPCQGASIPMSEEFVDCPGTSEPVSALRCLQASLQSHHQRLMSGFSFLELGVLFNAERIEQLSPWHAYALPRETSLWGAETGRYRYLLGARVRIQGTSIAFHFYTTHLGTIKCRDCQIQSAQQILALVRNAYVAGDYPPLLVGDFNAEIENAVGLPTNTKMMTLLSEAFGDVGAQFQVQGIDHIWLGLNAAFPRSPGGWEAVEFDKVWRVRNEGLSDHPMLIARIRPYARAR